MSVINQLTARTMLFIKTATIGWIQTNNNSNRLKLFLSTSMLHRLYLLPQAFHKRRLFVTATAELDMTLKIAAERWAHIPTLGESDFSPFTAGWLLMVRKPWLLIFTNLSLICTVSGCNPSASDQGFVLSSPAQYLANICNKHSISTSQKHLNRMPMCLHSSCNSF